MWKRAWKDTLPAIGVHNRSNVIRNIFLVILALFFIRYLGGQLQMSEELRWVISTILAIGIVFAGIFLFNLVRAPVLIRWEKEQIPSIVVSLHSGRRQWDYEHQHLMWVELGITNTSPTLPIKDVEIQVKNLVDVLPRQDEPGKYLLYVIQQWSPTGICWSERFAPPNQLRLTIPPNSTRHALIAFSNDSNGMWTIFNAPIANKPRYVGGAKITIAVSSPDSALWQGDFYIECHPNYTDGTRARFEFVEWDVWVASHDIVAHPSIADKEGSQT